MFDVLVYTDCDPDESLNGLSGFQFTAKSHGATLTDEGVVRERMLHEGPITLSAEDWRSHPPTCAYAVVGDRLYLSRGRSTGRTLSGRPGNQLTQTIATGDQYSILPQRPAQLYSASNWAFERPAERELPGWETPLEIDPEFEVGGLHSLIEQDPWATALLPTFLTMVEQTQAEPRTRLIIKHPEQEVVMKWIALASQFLDDEAALALEFRVFVEKPISCSAHIVGAHPLTSPNLTAARCEESGFNFIDLEARECTAIEISPAAMKHARWFLAGDPYEALEAVAASRRWTAVIPAGAAAEAAEIACLTSDQARIEPTGLRAAIAALAGLAAAGCFDELESYGEQLVDAVAGCGHGDPADLLAMVDCLWRLDAGGQVALAQGVALASLEWAAARPEAASEWARERSLRATSQLQWADADAQQHAASLTVSILHATATRDLPAMFSILNSLGTGVAAKEVQRDINRLADSWAAEPTLANNPRAWLHYPSVLQRLRVVLATALSQRDARAVGMLRNGAWDWLLPSPWVFDPQDPMAPWLATRALRAADPSDRQAILQAVEATLPSWAWELVFDTSSAIDPHMAASWIRAHGEIDPAFARPLESTILRGLRGEASRAGTLDLLDTLSLVGVGGVTQKMAGFVQTHRQTIHLFTQARQQVNAVPNPALLELAKVRTQLACLYGDRAVQMLLEVADTDSAAKLVSLSGGTIELELQAELERRLRVGDASALLWALKLRRAHEHTIAHSAKTALDHVWDDPTTESLRQEMTRRLPSEWVPSYEDYAHSQSKGRLTRGILKTAKSMLPRKEAP